MKDNHIYRSTIKHFDAVINTFLSILYQKLFLNESLTKFWSSLQFRDLGKTTN